MAVISLKKIKEIANKNNETYILDLGKIDEKLSNICIPIKVKTFEETLRLKSSFKLKKEKLTIEYKPFTRLPKQLREIVLEDPSYRKGMTENTYYQLIKLDDDRDKIERMKYRERMFNVVIHIDMDYKNDEGKSMWEDAGLSENDYSGLVDLFSNIIQYENHLELLEVVVDSIRSGKCGDDELSQMIATYNIRKYLDTLSEDEKKEFFDNLSKIKELEKSIEENINEE